MKHFTFYKQLISGLRLAMSRVWKVTFFAKVKFEMHKTYWKFTSRPGTLWKFLSLLTIHIHQNFLHGNFPIYIKHIQIKMLCDGSVDCLTNSKQSICSIRLINQTLRHQELGLDQKLLKYKYINKKPEISDNGGSGPLCSIIALFFQILKVCPFYLTFAVITLKVWVLNFHRNCASRQTLMYFLY